MLCQMKFLLISKIDGYMKGTVYAHMKFLENYLGFEMFNVKIDNLLAKK